MTGRIRRRPVVLAAVAAGLAVLVAAALLADRLLPPDLARHGDRSALVVDRDGALLRGFLAADGAWRLPVEAARVDPLYRAMLIAVEDKRFAVHPGIDPLAVARAIGQWVRHGRVVSGASTLTMQTARLLEPRARTLRAKAIEALRAMQLERRHDKAAILSLYLTLAPFGGNLHGVRAASLAYFGKEPAQLRPAEAALLVALPQAPTALRPDRHPEAARRARDRVLARAVEAGVLDAAAARLAAAEPVPTTRRPLPFLAPHLARRLVSTAPPRDVVATTIDGRLQAGLEGLARRALGTLDPQAGLAILVVDARSRAVLAYVGAPDPFSVARDGAVDMVPAVRSPGSTLKPILYAIGFDELVLHPATLVADRPTAFGDYAPSNFDHGFRGWVTAREALQLSLNVPAVMVLDRIGPERFAARLARAGARLQLPDAGAPALPVALGGAGTSLWDLVGLYAALADGGLARPLRVDAGQPERGQPEGAATALVSPASAWQVTRILEDAPPPPGVAPPAIGRGRPLAFKTGTSYGFRDAWALGYDRRHVVGVWTGRPDGSPSPGRYGRVTGAPLLFQVFDLLPPPPPGPDPAPPGVDHALRAGDLPPALRRLSGPAGTRVADGPRPPAIAFPPDGAALPWAGQAEDGVPLVAEGGRAPLTWLVDGRPLPVRGPPTWRPQGRGHARITVIDAGGRADSAAVRID